MSFNQFTVLGSKNQDSDFDRDEKKFHPRIESCTFRKDGGGREAAELTACGLANRGLDTERFSSEEFKDCPGGVKSAHHGRRNNPTLLADQRLEKNGGAESQPDGAESPAKQWPTMPTIQPLEPIMSAEELARRLK